MRLRSCRRCRSGKRRASGDVSGVSAIGAPVRSGATAAGTHARVWRVGRSTEHGHATCGRVPDGPRGHLRRRLDVRCLPPRRRCVLSHGCRVRCRVVRRARGRQRGVGRKRARIETARRGCSKRTLERHESAFGEGKTDTERPANGIGGVEKHRVSVGSQRSIYALEVYFVTALVPSETACLASSPGRMRRTAVWISRDERVPFLL